MLALLFPVKSQVRPSPALQVYGASQSAVKDGLITKGSLKILGLKVAFEPDMISQTTGDGQFLEILPDSIPCNGFLVDPPPHDTPYFYDQLRAVGNYFDEVSRGQLNIDMAGSLIYPVDGAVSVGQMAEYAPTGKGDDKDETSLVTLAQEALSAVESALDFAAYDLIVIFHAGLGQDFDYGGIDPTPQDLPSAFYDEDLIFKATGSPTLPLESGATVDIPVILAPEGQNHIYYDVAGEIFYGETDLCDIQLGLTGTLTLLFGYALGFPPLFDTLTGTPGVGVFGMMDLGSNNGQGVIPAPPDAWTRTWLGWDVPAEADGEVTLRSRPMTDSAIVKIRLSADEYYLIENRLNWILPGVDMDSLRYRNHTKDEFGSLILPHYFDILTDSVGVTISDSTGVIIDVPHYDLGLPGSGLLIWHVDESRMNVNMAGINNDPEARAVRLVEADGAVDIGFPTTALFDDPSVGWRFDLWYAGNEGWFYANPTWEKENPDKLLTLAHDTRPSSRLNTGAASGVSMSGIGPAGLYQTFTIAYDDNLTRLPSASRLLGYSGQQWIWALNDSIFIGEKSYQFPGYPDSILIVSGFDEDQLDRDAPFWIVAGIEGSRYLARRYSHSGTWDEVEDTLSVNDAYIEAGRLHLGVQADGDIPPSPDTALVVYEDLSLTLNRPYSGFFTGSSSTSNLSEVWEGQPEHVAGKVAPSLADLDGDGLDEVVYTSVAQLETTTDGQDIAVYGVGAYELLSGITLDGFPYAAETVSATLVANLLGDAYPELVLVTAAELHIISHDGALVTRLARQGVLHDPVFLFEHTDGRIGLADGHRIHWYEPEKPQIYWATDEGRHSRIRRSLNLGFFWINQPAVMDENRTYCYPNPVQNGVTTIRFYVGQAQSATIRVYTVDGVMVERYSTSNLIHDGYNEWQWHVGSAPGGIYYAHVEVQGSVTMQKLIKIAVIR